MMAKWLAKDAIGAADGGAGSGAGNGGQRRRKRRGQRRGRRCGRWRLGGCRKLPPPTTSTNSAWSVL